MLPCIERHEYFTSSIKSEWDQTLIPTIGWKTGGGSISVHHISLYNAPVPLTILTSSDAYLIPKMRKFQRSDEFWNLQCYHALNAMSTTRQAWESEWDQTLISTIGCKTGRGSISVHHILLFKSVTRNNSWQHLFANFSKLIQLS